jgi:hypothetical protein
LKPLTAGLTNLHIYQKPIYNICVKGCLLNTSCQEKDNYAPGDYQHRHKFRLVTISGIKKSQQDLYYILVVTQLLTRKGGIVIMEGVKPGSDSWKAWQKAVDQNIIEWDNSNTFSNGDRVWVFGTYKNIVCTISMSELMLGVILDYCGTSTSSTQSGIVFYKTSQEREDEIRNAYKRDIQIETMNATSIIHSIMLKCLFPNINVRLTPEEPDPYPEPEPEPETEPEPEPETEPEPEMVAAHTQTRRFFHQYIK